MKIWTLLRKEEQDNDKNPPQKKGEHVDDMNPPRIWGVMIILSSMTNDSEASVLKRQSTIEDDNKVQHSLMEDIIVS